MFIHHFSDDDEEENMTRTIESLGIAAGFALLIGMPVAASAYTGQNLAPQARVTIEQARSIAQKTIPGTITDEELEQERGGSGLRYSFDIKRDHKTYEVGVDARTGTVLEHKVEGPNPD
ncbi:MAG TPA: PepSY domain-containing protein [Stellaceae bacterium]|nr:PepSY domain-containing protein [Stellaceae bacterium]